MARVGSLEGAGDYCDNQSQVEAEDRSGSGLLYLWDRTIVKLRSSLSRTKVRGKTPEDSNILADQRDSVRLSTDTSQEFL